MRMGVFWGRLGLERIGPRILESAKRRTAVSSDIKMASALLAGWQRPAYVTSDLPLDAAEWGSSLERQRWVLPQRLISLLMGQLAWEECCLSTCTGKQKTAFQTLCAASFGPCDIWRCCYAGFRTWPARRVAEKFLFWDEAMIMMWDYKRWESRPAHLQCVCIGEAYPDTCFQLAGLLHVNAS